jgi:hypothetical protein
MLADYSTVSWSWKYDESRLTIVPKMVREHGEWLAMIQQGLSVGRGDLRNLMGYANGSMWIAHHYLDVFRLLGLL